MDYQLRLELVCRASKMSVCEFLGREKHADSHRQYFASVRPGFPCHLSDLLTQVVGKFPPSPVAFICLACTCVLYTCVLGTDVSAENNHSNLQG